MWKKLISVFMALSMIQCISISAFADADNGLVFDMDLSEYGNDGGIIKNAVNGSSDGIEIKGAKNGQRPKLGTFESMTGETKYLMFAGLRGKSVFYKYGSVDLSKEISEPLQNQKSMTVEFWVNYIATENGKTESGRVFNFGPESGSNDSNNSFEIYAYDGLNQYFVRYARKDMNASQYLEKRIDFGGDLNTWTHYAVTREWNEKTNTYVGNVYVNGESKGTVDGGIKIDETDFRIQIGNMAGGDILNGSLGLFRLYNTALSAEDVRARYNSSKPSFMTMKNTMNVISPDEGKTVDSLPGEIEIIFDNFVDKSTIGDITFRKSDGTEIPGGIEIYTNDDLAMNVYIRYSKLEKDSEYILNIPDTVCSLNGVSCGGKQFVYETQGSYIFYEDFEKYEVGGKPDGTKLTYTSNDITDSLESVEIKEAPGAAEGSKKKYVSLITNAPEGKASNSTVSVDFDTPITYDFVVELGIRGQNGTAAARNTRFYGTSGQFAIIGNFQNGADLRSDTSMGVDKDKHDSLYKQFSTAAKDEFGFIRMKYIFQKDTDGKYIVTGTCLDDENVDYRMPLIHTDCKQLMAIQQYNSPNSDMCVDLSYIKVYKYIVPEIVSDNTKTLTKDSDEISIVMSEDIEASTVTEDCVRLVNSSTGKDVLTKVIGYDESKRQINIKLFEYLDYGEKYDLFIKNVRTVSDVPVRDGEKVTFTLRDYDLTVSNISVSGMDGTGDIIAAVEIKNSSKTDKSVKAFAVLYDKNGFYKASAIQNSLIASDSAERISVNLSEAKKEQGYFLEVYVWEKTDGGQNVILLNPYVVVKN